MVQFKAHWYAIVLPSTPSNYDDLHHAVFPALSKLTSIEERVMREVLLHCKLVQYRRGIGYSPLLAGWQEFIRENDLDEVEVTYFSVNRKKRFYVRLGAWDKTSHPSMTPSEMWSAALADKLVIPRL